METHLIGHGEAAVVGRGSPDVGDKGDVEEVDQVEPAVEDEPARLPVRRDKVDVALAGERPAVDEEEGEDDNDAHEDTPP
jgi:hypothetical protein